MMRNITKHIVHCSDSTHGDVAEIRRWHLERGWRDVGYHFIIRRDGEVEVGRPVNEAGAHCQGFNAESIGTCLVGKDTFTPEQFIALKRLHRGLKEQFPRVQLFGHCELNTQGKTCPNFDVHEVLGE
ncbi:MAG: N-acetylmuramoyl-L-alanine amidase [Alphaproteobacteria bacterium]